MLVLCDGSAVSVPLKAVDPDHPCCQNCTERTRYARDLADAMGLRDWGVAVRHEAPRDPNLLVEVRLADGRREMELSFCEDFALLEPDQQRHAVVHELVHPHLRDLWGAVEDGAREAFGGMAFRVYTANVRREVEKSTDAFAAIIAMHMPEPPW